MSDELNPEDVEGEPLPEDAFDALIKNQPAEEEGPVELSSLWEGIEYIWKKFNPGVLVKGIVLAEYVDEEGQRTFKWLTSSEMASWEAIGMLSTAMMDLQSEALVMGVVDTLVNSEDDDEEEGEQ